MNEPLINEYVSYALDYDAVIDLYPTRMDLDAHLQQEILGALNTRLKSLFYQMTEVEQQRSAYLVGVAKQRLGASTPTPELVRYISLAVSLVNITIFSCGEPEKQRKEVDSAMSLLWEKMSSGERDKAIEITQQMDIDVDLSRDFSTEAYLRRMVRLAKARGILCVLERTFHCIIERNVHSPLGETFNLLSGIHSVVMRPDDVTTNAMSIVIDKDIFVRLRFDEEDAREDLWIHITKIDKEIDRGDDDEIIGNIVTEPCDIKGFMKGEEVAFARGEVHDIFLPTTNGPIPGSATDSITTILKASRKPPTRETPTIIWRNMSYRERVHVMTFATDLKRIKPEYLPDVPNSNVLPPERSPAPSP